MREQINNSILDLGIETCSYFVFGEGWGDTTPGFCINIGYGCSHRVRCLDWSQVKLIKESIRGELLYFKQFQRHSVSWHCARRELWTWKHSPCCWSWLPVFKLGRFPIRHVLGTQQKWLLAILWKCPGFLPFHFFLCCSPFFLFEFGSRLFGLIACLISAHTLNLMKDRFHWCI